MSFSQRVALGIAGGGSFLFVLGLLLGRVGLWQTAAVTVVVGLAIGAAGVPALKGYQYTFWIIAAVTAAMIFPSAFLRWGEIDLRNRWVVLLVVQVVMFGMGTQMRLRDFVGVIKMPWGVVVAIVCQFTIMPLTGYALTRVFDFPPEIAAGVILIGSCASGLASNVMCYLAGANLALSVTATACTTLLAPVMTPLWMKVLAGTLVEVNFVNLMVEIVKIVLVPIGAALLHDYLRFAGVRGRRLVTIVLVLAASWLAWIGFGGWEALRERLTPGALTCAGLFGFICAAVVVGVFYHLVTRVWPRIDRLMPRASMAGIVYFTTVTTAAGRDNLLQVGLLLVLAAILHNTIGYGLGYGLSRACRLDHQSARAIAFEVGLQNGGMASGLAGAMGKLGTVGLAAAIFSPWMNVSGSLLANFWRRRPVSPEGAK